jgi:deoxyribodipyrimidine photolyase-related protein
MKPINTNANLVSAWILNDQLMDPDKHPTLLDALRLTEGRRDLVRVVMIESHRHFSALPYHKKRLALIISAGRHFAEELRSKGWQVDCISAESFRQGLRKHWETHSWQQCVTMRAAENSTSALQEDLKSSFKDATFEIIPNGQFYWPQTENAKPTTKSNFE